jgi:ribosomal protein L16 Arg81 hydroxylase
MSRGRTRARRRRRAHMEKLRAEFEQTRSDPEAFEQFLRRLAASDQSVWAIARSAATEKPLDDAEAAMIAQIVAPHLAGMTPGSVHHRHLLAS